MKVRLFLILLWKLAATPVLASQQTAIAFDHTNLVQKSTDYYEYADHRTITAGSQLTLPAGEYLLALHEDEHPAWIRGQSANRRIVGDRNIQYDLRDIITSDNPSYNLLVQSQFSTSPIGSEPIHVVGTVNIDDQRYAELLVLPITADSIGHLWFNQSIEVTVGGRIVTSSDLVPRDSLVNDRTDPIRNNQGSSALTAGTEYVIITNQDLAAAFESLAAYKNETGYITQVELIEDIISSYDGRDDAERLREYLKDFYFEGGQYVLLAGDETVVPIRHAYHYNTDSAPDSSVLQICDLYYADLTGEWNVDDDAVWGEKYDDQPDIAPELMVGRLPINSAEEAENYINKLVIYETTPGGDDRSYLEHVFFFSSDHMRDMPEGGQHKAIGTAYPSWFTIDTTVAIEQNSGWDEVPTNASAASLAPVIKGNFGIINVLAHGRSDGFTVKSSGYGSWPKSYFLTSEQDGIHGCLDSLNIMDKPAFYYSLACDNGAFDMDQPPFNHGNPIMAQALIGSNGGAVGFVAYSRWGWVSSSHLLQKAFFDSLFAHPERPAVEAMNAVKQKYYYLTDLVYGQNFYGDPTLRVYHRCPDSLSIEGESDSNGLEIRIHSNSVPVEGCKVILAADGTMLGEYVTNHKGMVVIDFQFEHDKGYKLSAVMPGATISQAIYLHSMVTEAEDDATELPVNFALYQNYPNPFNPSTVISFDLPEQTDVNLKVYNVLGQVVATLIDGTTPSCHHEIAWNSCDHNGQTVASGVYFYRLVTDQQSLVKKMILIR